MITIESELEALIDDIENRKIPREEAKLLIAPIVDEILDRGIRTGLLTLEIVDGEQVFSLTELGKELNIIFEDETLG